jgi:hypothetical protein
VTGVRLSPPAPILGSVRRRLPIIGRSTGVQLIVRLAQLYAEPDSAFHKSYSGAGVKLYSLPTRTSSFKLYYLFLNSSVATDPAAEALPSDEGLSAAVLRTWATPRRAD